MHWVDILEAFIIVTITGSFLTILRLLLKTNFGIGHHLQSFAGYLRLPVIFAWRGALRGGGLGGGGLISDFKGLFANICKAFILAGGLSAGLSFCVIIHFPGIS